MLRVATDGVLHTRLAAGEFVPLRAAVSCGRGWFDIGESGFWPFSRRGLRRIPWLAAAGVAAQRFEVLAVVVVARRYGVLEAGGAVSRRRRNVPDAVVHVDTSDSVSDGMEAAVSISCDKFSSSIICEG